MRMRQHQKPNIYYVKVRNQLEVVEGLAENDRMITEILSRKGYIEGLHIFITITEQQFNIRGVGPCEQGLSIAWILFRA